MKQKDYIQITGIIFVVIAALHAWRLLAGWDVVLGNYSVPAWLSVAALILAGYLAYSSQRLKK